MVTAQPQHQQGPLRLGFVPLTDCAPIAVAQEMGLFKRYDLDVTLSREMGWSSIRDKIYYGDLDAAQCIAGMAFAIGLGFTELRRDVIVPMILNLHGNAVTLSMEFDPAVIGKGEGLQRFLAQRKNKNRPFTLAATHKFSSHHILLHMWLRRHGIDAAKDAEIVFLPPPLMPRHLKAGHIDGYCVGEPWNSEALIHEYGWCPVTSPDLSEGHPEKVLLMTGSFLQERREESVRLVSALLDACKMCHEPDFLDELVAILSMPAYTGASQSVVRTGFMSDQAATRKAIESNSSMQLFHGENVNRPTVEKASWVLAGLRSIGALPEMTAGSLSRIYREDIYCAAKRRVGHF